MSEQKRTRTPSPTPSEDVLNILDNGTTASTELRDLLEISPVGDEGAAQAGAGEGGQPSDDDVVVVGSKRKRATPIIVQQLRLHVHCHCRAADKQVPTRTREIATSTGPDGADFRAASGTIYQITAQDLKQAINRQRWRSRHQSHQGKGKGNQPPHQIGKAHPASNQASQSSTSSVPRRIWADMDNPFNTKESTEQKHRKSSYALCCLWATSSPQSSCHWVEFFSDSNWPLPLISPLVQSRVALLVGRDVLGGPSQFCQSLLSFLEV